MKHIARIPIMLAPLLAAPAFASTPADNIAWSASPAKTVASSSICSAYSGRMISSGEPLSAESVLKAVGTSLATAALAGVAGGYQGAAPNPCPPPGL
ncbi:hypothetical protein DM40_2531 [Burkholderia cenocepacia]|nr:hypothetical protein DM40_2531 [Burkholderia cenocepacia]